MIRSRVNGSWIVLAWTCGPSGVITRQYEPYASRLTTRFSSTQSASGDAHVHQAVVATGRPSDAVGTGDTNGPGGLSPHLSGVSPFSSPGKACSPSASRGILSHIIIRYHLNNLCEFIVIGLPRSCLAVLPGK